MAEKTEVLETDSVIAAKVILLKSILEVDDYGIEAILEAMKILGSLTELKFKKKSEASLMVDDNIVGPEEFRCPLSKQIMSDPVVLATGQTYDRYYIQRWLDKGNLTCPKTQEILTHTDLTPNHLVQDMISRWCKERGIKLPQPSHHIVKEVITSADRGYLNSLLQKMSSSISDQKAAVKEIRLLTKEVPFFQGLFGEFVDDIHRLLNPLSLFTAGMDPDFKEDLITTALNISLHGNNKKKLAENPVVIPMLIESLKSGPIETRTNAAAALVSLSELDSNIPIIGKSGALKPLIDLLDEGHPLGMQDTALAIFNLCFDLDNKERAVRQGAVPVILKKIMEKMFCRVLLPVLRLLSDNRMAVKESRRMAFKESGWMDFKESGRKSVKESGQKAVKESSRMAVGVMVELGAVPCLLSIIRESTSQREKENCVEILQNICYHDMSKLMEIREEENANGTLSKLAQSGTARAARIINRFLEKPNEAGSSTNAA